MSETIRIGSPEGSLRLGATIDTAGAWVTNLSLGERNVLYPRAELVDQNGGIKKRGGLHICSPWFGPIKDPQHGPARDAEWSRVATSTPGMNSTPNSINNGVRLSWFPEVGSQAEGIAHQIDYTIFGGNTFLATLRLKNIGTDAVAFVAPGFHPYFDTTDGTTESDIRGVYTPAEVGGVVVLSDLDIEAECRGEDPTSRNTLTLGTNKFIVTSNMRTNVRWSDDLSCYLCFEPTVCGSSLDPQDGAIRLRRGEEADFYMSIKALEPESRSPKLS
jgi:hypothetical protein